MRLNAGRLDTATFIITQIRDRCQGHPGPYRQHAKRAERQRVSSNGPVVGNASDRRVGSRVSQRVSF